ncbi:uncharacterized protein TNCV_4447141 [Trichonephila clavipes]|nr:uncharacterized protein TNCV_4447141 [Trichonephila clavipes]
MLGSRTDLHIFDAGSVNGTRYCNEILLPYVRLFRGAMGLQILFMDLNAPCHRTVAAEQLLESKDIERMDWTARSPDLNPIEHVWDFLGRRLAARTLPPVTIRELRLALCKQGYKEAEKKNSNTLMAQKKIHWKVVLQEVLEIMIRSHLAGLTAALHGIPYGIPYVLKDHPGQSCVEDLIVRIPETNERIPDMPGIFDNVRNSMQHHCQVFWMTCGRNFEHLF